MSQEPVNIKVIKKFIYKADVPPDGETGELYTSGNNELCLEVFVPFLLNEVIDAKSP